MINIGGLAETPLHGGLVGPTFACIIGIQFRNLRKCDRFWYENGNPLIRFTEAQLAEIRKVTLSKVICNNCDQVTNIQRAMFDIPDPFLNPRVPCNALPEINLELWKERVACNVGGTTINTGMYCTVLTLEIFFILFYFPPKKMPKIHPIIEHILIFL